MDKALATARATGKATAVADLTSPVQQVLAQPGGGFELRANPEPVRTKQHGSWKPVDTRLHRTADGSWAPAATAYGTVRFSPGGTGPLVTTRYGTTGMAIGWPTKLPKPTVSGARLTYTAVLPGVNLVVAATASGGFTDTLVVTSAKAAHDPGLAHLRLATTVSGGTQVASRGGSLAVLDHRGREIMDAPTPMMWDSNTTLPTPAKKASAAKVAADPSDAGHPGLAAHLAPVAAKVTAHTLTLVPNAKLLAASSTRFPLYVDPTFNWHPYDPSAPAFDEVKQGCPGNSFYNSTSDLADGGRLGVGYNGWPEGYCYTGREHAVYQWNLSSTLYGAHINSATVEASEVYTAGCSGSHTVNLHWSGGLHSNTDWSNRPGYLSYSTSASYGPSYNPTYCSGNGTVSHGLSVTSPIAHNAAENASTFTATLSEDSLESSHDDSGFARFADNPALEVFYNHTPNAPTSSTMAAVSGADNAACVTSGDYPFMGKTLASTPPVLKAKVSDKDGDKLQATFQYWIDGTTTMHTGTSGDNLASGSYATYSLPASFVSSLTNGQTVDWNLEITDGQATTSYGQSPTCHFTAEPTAPDAPVVSSYDSKYPDADNGGAVGAAAGTEGYFAAQSSGTTRVQEFVFSLDVPPPTTNPPNADVTLASGNAGAMYETPPSPGPHTVWVYAVDDAGDISGTSAYRFVAAGDASTTCSSLASCYDNTGISPDSDPSKADLDGSGDSFSATDLAGAGWASGGKATINGTTFTLPAFGSGQADNVLAHNQTVNFTGSGSALTFLATSTWSNLSTTPGAIDGDYTAPYVPAGTWVASSYCFSGPDANAYCPSTGVITYTDGSTAPYYLTVPGWTVPEQSLAALTLPHRNNTSGQETKPHMLYAFSVPIDSSKTIASVTLPDVGNSTSAESQALHIFSMGTRNTTTATPKADGSSAATASGTSWTGSWADPTEGSFNFQGSNFSNQTFRIALKPTLSGTTMRVKLDNALATSKLSIGHATVATDVMNESQGTPTDQPTATPTGLTFGGSSAVTIPAGGSVYSDPISFPVTANRYLLLSYQLASSTPYLVEHTYADSAYEYVSAAGSGDKTTDTTGTPFTGSGTYQGWYTNLLTGLDVTSAGTPTQAVLGDGLIDPAQPNSKAVLWGHRIPEALAAAEPTTPHPYGTLAEGIEANNLATDNPQTLNGSAIGGPSALSRIDRDILDQPGISSVIVNEGLEDLLGGADPGALDGNAYAALSQQLKGWNISATYASLTPCQGYAGDGASANDPCSAAVDANRQDVNAFLADDSLGTPFDPVPSYFVDLDSTVAVTDATSGAEKLHTNADTGDHANLTDPAFGAETNLLLAPHDTWNLDDGAGFTTATDTAPQGTPYGSDDATVGANPLTLSGTTTWTSDTTRGQTLAFDGQTGAAESAGPVLDTTRSFSLSAWVDPASLPTHNATIASQDATTNSAFDLQYNYAQNGSPEWDFALAQTDTSNAQFANATATGVTAGTWTHLVATYNATTQTAYLYVNGTLQGVANQVTPFTSGGPFALGRGQYDANPTDYFPGQISDVQTWNYTLAPTQVQALDQQIN
ncbi:hypothetical protein BIV57_00140 [Mangrovactinospora gilvigrisea]|uniref:LamG-like jellyroll fold domain-containing protein n=2 Tax=Mangrovactinospora gilvigrisea TaxID=1428644 RepID=A0A1J7BLB7_9ACTN|nr:hypothetical protein BIV57_00140 [Mangrovactinospora gilvigrisea]